MFLVLTLSKVDVYGMNYLVIEYFRKQSICLCQFQTPARTLMPCVGCLSRPSSDSTYCMFLGHIHIWVSAHRRWWQCSLLCRGQTRKHSVSISDLKSLRSSKSRHQDIVSIVDVHSRLILNKWNNVYQLGMCGFTHIKCEGKREGGQMSKINFISWLQRSHNQRSRQ